MFGLRNLTIGAVYAIALTGFVQAGTIERRFLDKGTSCECTGAENNDAATGVCCGLQNAYMDQSGSPAQCRAKQLRALHLWQMNSIDTLPFTNCCRQNGAKDATCAVK